MSDQQSVSAPAAPVLESMNIGMILDKAIHLYASNFLLLIAITAIPQVIYAVGSMLISAITTTAPGVTFVGGVLLLVSVVATGIGGGAMTMVVGSRYLGRDISFAAAYAAALRKAGRIIGGTLLAALFIGLGAMGFLVPGLILAISYSLISPVIMLEGVKGAKSLKRSRLLIKGYRWQAFLLYFLYWCAIYVGIIIMTVIVGGLAGLGIGESWTRYATVLLTPVATVLLGPFSGVLSVLLYYNQRIRKESFDLAFLAEAMAPHVT